MFTVVYRYLSLSSVVFTLFIDIRTDKCSQYVPIIVYESEKVMYIAKTIVVFGSD